MKVVVINTASGIIVEVHNHGSISLRRYAKGQDDEARRFAVELSYVLGLDGEWENQKSG